MKKIGFLSLFLLTLFVFTVALVSKSESAATSTASTSTIEQTQMAAMIKPTLESYMKNHPNPQVRVWSMVIITNISKLTSEQLSSITPLLAQLGSNDINVRQIASSSIRTILNLEERQWKVIAGTIFRTIAKTTKYPEVKKLAIQSIAALQKSTTGTTTTGTTTSSTSTSSSGTTSDSTAMTDTIDSLLLLFDLADDEDPEIHQVAIDNIKEILDTFNSYSNSTGFDRNTTGGGAIINVNPPK